MAIRPTTVSSAIGGFMGGMERGRKWKREDRAEARIDKQEERKGEEWDMRQEKHGWDREKHDWSMEKERERHELWKADVEATIEWRKARAESERYGRKAKSLGSKARKGMLQSSYHMALFDLPEIALRDLNMSLPPGSKQAIDVNIDSEGNMVITNEDQSTRVWNRQELAEMGILGSQVAERYKRIGQDLKAQRRAVRLTQLKDLYEGVDERVAGEEGAENPFGKTMAEGIEAMLDDPRTSFADIATALQLTPKNPGKLTALEEQLKAKSLQLKEMTPPMFKTKGATAEYTKKRNDLRAEVEKLTQTLAGKKKAVDFRRTTPWHALNGIIRREQAQRRQVSAGMARRYAEGVEQGVGGPAVGPGGQAAGGPPRGMSIPREKIDLPDDVFKRLDTHGDGVITQDEFDHWKSWAKKVLAETDPSSGLPQAQVPWTEAAVKDALEVYKALSAFDNE